jgi:hypothetical protein
LYWLNARQNPDLAPAKLDKKKILLIIFHDNGIAVF